MSLELSRLPTELLADIIGHLDHDDLRRAALVSSLWRDLCQRLLFRHVKQPGSAAYYERDMCKQRYSTPRDPLDCFEEPGTDSNCEWTFGRAFRPPPQGHSLRDLLRIIVHHPELGSAVRSMLVWSWVPSPDEEDPATTAWLSTVDPSIARLRDELWAGLPTEALLESHRDSPSERSRVVYCQEVILLLTFMPGLESLVLDLPFRATTNFMDQLIQDARVSKSSRRLQLPSLTTLEVDYPTYYLDYSVQNILGLLELPALTTFRGHWLSGGIDLLTETPGQIRDIHIKHVDLVCCDFTNDSLCALFRACKGLETYRLVYGWDDDENMCHLDFDAISESLQGHRTSLRSLVIDVSPERAVSTSLVRTRGQIDLSSFAQLVHVDLPSWALMGPSLDRMPSDVDKCHCDEPLRRGDRYREITAVLPQSLETLVIRNARKSNASPLFDFARTNPNAHLPALRHLCLIMSHRNPLTDEELEVARRGSPAIFRMVK